VGSEKWIPEYFHDGANKYNGTRLEWYRANIKGRIRYNLPYVERWMEKGANIS